MQLTAKRYPKHNWRRAFSTRRGTVLAGLICAVMAGAVIVFAMARYRSSVDATGNPLTVLVATQRIPKNTAGDVVAGEGLFRPTQIVAKQVAAGAVADAAAIQGRVAVRDIFPGEQLTAADFSAGGLPAQIAPTERAMTVSLDSQHGMATSLHDGDRVDVYATFSVSATLGREQPVSRLLMRGIRVLKAASDGSGGGGSGIGSPSNSNASDVTLQIPDAEAGTLSWAQDNGKLWLVLRGDNATNTSVPALVTAQSIVLGTAPVSNGGNR